LLAERGLLVDHVTVWRRVQRYPIGLRSDFIGSPWEWLWGKPRIGELAAAEFTKQMLHMPGIVYSSPPFAADTFKMEETDDYLNLHISIYFVLTSFWEKAH
jgi:hypothetical protein